MKQSLEAAVRRILTPKTSVDIMRDIAAVQQTEQRRPYTMTFIGVNGVGKSTNLAKTCFWLVQNKLKVLIAACDTFRSGAVEQLRVHVRNLKALDATAQVELFERGYGKDSAGIAKEAIQFGTCMAPTRAIRWPAHHSSFVFCPAKSEKFDVVLIDTAGRMQDNEPLMRALAKVRWRVYPPGGGGGGGGGGWTHSLTHSLCPAPRPSL